MIDEAARERAKSPSAPPKPRARVALRPADGSAPSVSALAAAANRFTSGAAESRDSHFCHLGQLNWRLIERRIGTSDDGCAIHFRFGVLSRRGHRTMIASHVRRLASRSSEIEIEPDSELESEGERPKLARPPARRMQMGRRRRSIKPEERAKRPPSDLRAPLMLMPADTPSRLSFGGADRTGEAADATSAPPPRARARCPLDGPIR